MDAKLKALLADPSKKMDAAELSYLAACFRRTMFSVLHERGTGHWGGAASAAELVTSLYFNRLRINPADPQWADRDRFILSKGHASVNLYTVLAARGFFSEDLLPSFRTPPGPSCNAQGSWCRYVHRCSRTWTFSRPRYGYGCKALRQEVLDICNDR